MPTQLATVAQSYLANVNWSKIFTNVYESEAQKEIGLVNPLVGLGRVVFDY